MKNKQKVPLVRATRIRTNKLVEIHNVKDVEIGDTVRVLNKKKRILVEGVIEFIDFSIPFGNVLITINKKVYPGHLDFFLVKKGNQTYKQKFLKSERLNKVLKRKLHCDSGKF